MSLSDVWNEYRPDIDFSKFLRKNTGQPPLDCSRLFIENYSEEERGVIGVPLEGVVTSALKYKKRIGQVLSIGESNDFETWEIPQIQGVKASGYRTQTGLDTIALWAEVIEGALPAAREGGVRQLMIPDPYLITNITDAKSESALLRYNRLAQILKMQFSK